MCGKSEAYKNKTIVEINWLVMILIFFKCEVKVVNTFYFLSRIKKTHEENAFDFVSNMMLRLTFFHFISKI